MPGLERANKNDALRELGAMAAERREQMNMSLEDVYDRTRIRIEYLRGIEAGNYEGFPEPVYVKGFVRTYLRLIEAEDLLDDFVAQLNRLRPKSQEPATANILGNATMGPKGFKPASHFWLFLVLVLALAGTGGYVWYAWSNGSINNVNVFNIDSWRWPNFTQGSGSQETPAASKDIAEKTSADVPMAVPVSRDVKKVSPPKPRPYLLIQARGDVWMGVTIGNKSVFSRTLKSGNIVSWDLTAPAQVRLGRPNMANITLNGKDLGPANAKGSKKSETFLYRPDGTWEKVK